MDTSSESPPHDPAAPRSPATLQDRLALLEAVIESLPFDFWMNDLTNRTILQNSVSRALWGDQMGNRMEEVQDNPEITDQWILTNREALAGNTQTGEITYQINDEERTFRNIVAPVRDGDSIIGVFGANVDITELKRALRDRDLLLRELNHRVKNHLQMILSMISLQRDPCPEREGDTFHQIEKRIQAVLLVHDQLYETDDLHTIDLRKYTTQLIAAVRSGYGNRVAYQPFSTGIPIDYNHAVPYGVALTELTLNAISHGLDTEPITITATHDGLTISITVENLVDVTTFDPTTVAPPRDDTTTGGLRVVQAVISQFSGTLDSEYKNGRYRATLSIPFPVA